MSLPVPGTLAPGLSVRPWRHFFGSFTLAERLALHAGLRVGAQGRLEPDGAPRAATPAELSLLDARGLAPEAPALEVLTTPALLREHFWALDPAELPGAQPPGAATGGPGPSSRWEAFAEDVRRFVAHVRAPVTQAHALLLTVLDPSEPPGLFEAGPGRTLLERDHGAPQPSDARVLHMNLSDGPLGLVFVNLPLAGMAALLTAQLVERAQPRGVAPADGRALVRHFAAACPRYPLARLTLAPGEGLLLPGAGVALDVDPRGADDLAVLLSLI